MIFRALNTIGLVATVVLAIGLYRAKADAQETREHMDALARTIEQERRTAGVLRAEIAFLERPERLRMLAERYLGLEPTAPDQEMTLEATLLALGAPPMDAPVTRFAAAEPAPAPVSQPVSGAAAPPPLRLAENAPAPAPVLTAAAPIPESASAPAPASVRVAQAPAVETAPMAPLGAPDPIADLIMAAGGVR